MYRALLSRFEIAPVATCHGGTIYPRITHNPHDVKLTFAHIRIGGSHGP